MAGAILTDLGARRPRADDPSARTRAARRTLLLLLLVCTLPVVASYVAYYLWQPQGRVNYGELLAPRPLDMPVLKGLGGQADFKPDELKGRWTLLYAGPSACSAACADALYLMRQSRLAQGQEMSRVARLWIVTDGGQRRLEFPGESDGLRIAAAASDGLEALPGSAAARHVYLVDPLGNVIIRFPEDADPRKVVKDLQRLLKYSALGRG